MFKKPSTTKQNKGGSVARNKHVSNDSDSDGVEQQGNGNQRNRVFRRRRRANFSGSSGSDDEQDADDVSTSVLLEQWKASRSSKTNNKQPESKVEEPKKRSKVGHEFQPDATGMLTAQEMATRVAEYHPEERTVDTTSSSTGEIPLDVSKDVKVYRGQIQQQNKFLAGPLRAPTFVRTTCRFDYQPDICKDYKETGFCGFGDTCIYLHDRGDTLSGWQLERQWEEKKKKETELKELQMNRFMDERENEEDEISGKHQLDDDGIPFACYICRGPFVNPVVTSCGHYFCSKCIMDSFVNISPCCPICSADTGGVFNHPSKLFAKKRRVVGNEKDWKDYANALKIDTNISS